jgi:prefoldin subunit 5
MEKISFIYPSDLGSLKQDDKGNFLVPEGFEIYRVESKAEQIEMLQKEIENINTIPVPSNDELIEMGKTIHPYYMEQQRKAILESKIKELK